VTLVQALYNSLLDNIASLYVGIVPGAELLFLKGDAVRLELRRPLRFTTARSPDSGGVHPVRPAAPGEGWSDDGHQLFSPRRESRRTVGARGGGPCDAQMDADGLLLIRHSEVSVGLPPGENPFRPGRTCPGATTNLLLYSTCGKHHQTASA